MARAGITIGYLVVVDADLAGVIPGSNSSAPSVGPSGLSVSEVLQGGSQSYCLCDVGPGQGLPDVETTLKKGAYVSMFKWNGHNWNGPSGTGNPKGALFPAGTYELDVTAMGQLVSGGTTRPFTVTGKYQITLIE